MRVCPKESGPTHLVWVVWWLMHTSVRTSCLAGHYISINFWSNHLDNSSRISQKFIGIGPFWRMNSGRIHMIAIGNPWNLHCFFRDTKWLFVVNYNQVADEYNCWMTHRHDPWVAIIPDTGAPAVACMVHTATRQPLALCCVLRSKSWSDWSVGYDSAMATDWWQVIAGESGG